MAPWNSHGTVTSWSLVSGVASGSWIPVHLRPSERNDPGGVLRDCQCALQLTEPHFHIRLILKMCSIDEPHSCRSGRHHDGLRVRAIARETYTLQ